MRNISKSKLPDLSGVCLSLLCALHCIATPWIGFLIILPNQEEHHHLFHELIIVVGIGLMGVSVYRNMKKGCPNIINGVLISGWMLFVCCEYLTNHSAVAQSIAGLLISIGHMGGMQQKPFLRA